jgi:hypothetical protein
VARKQLLEPVKTRVKGRTMLSRHSDQLSPLCPRLSNRQCGSATTHVLAASMCTSSSPDGKEDRGNKRGTRYLAIMLSRSATSLLSADTSPSSLAHLAMLFCSSHAIVLRPHKTKEYVRGALNTMLCAGSRVIWRMHVTSSRH